MADHQRPGASGKRALAGTWADSPVPKPSRSKRMRSPADLAGERGGFAPWCGPTVVALACDLPYYAACALLHDIAPERYPHGAEIVTAWWRDLLEALVQAGVAAEPLPSPPETARPTLCALVRRGMAPGWYLVRVTGHFLLLHVGSNGTARVFDNRHYGVELSARTHGRCRVTHLARLPEGVRAG